jgi:hypothetical protein
MKELYFYLGSLKTSFSFSLQWNGKGIEHNNYIALLEAGNFPTSEAPKRENKTAATVSRHIRTQAF